MSETLNGGSADDAAHPIEEHIDQERREVLTRLAKYTAPAMLAVLMSASASVAVPVSLASG
jgi:hypothetical protein